MAKKKATNRKKPTEDRSVSVSIEWHYPDGLNSHVANQLLVQTDEHSAYLSFFDLPPPIAFDADELKKRGSVRATCVARIVVPKGRLEAFAKVMKTMHEKQGKD